MKEPYFIKKNKLVDNTFKEQRKILIIAVFLVVTLFLGSSYALLTNFDKTDQVVTFKTGNLNMSVNNTNGLIDLNGKLPENDTEGLQNATVIPLTLTNTGTMKIGGYEVKLVKDTNQTSTLDEKYIKYAISEDGVTYKSPSILTENSNIVYTGYSLKVNQSKTIYLKLWIDEIAGNNALNKAYYGSIEVKLYQKLERPAGESAVYITEATYKSNVSADTNNSKIEEIYQNMINNMVVLSKTDGNSSITYQVTLYNSSEEELMFLGSSYDSSYKTNPNITYSLDGLNIGNTLGAGASITFNLTFYYLNKQIPVEGDVNYIENYNVFDSYLKFNFATNSGFEIINYDTYYSVYNENQTVPFLINNNNDYDIKGIVIYGGVELTEEITINANETNKLIPIELKEIYSSFNSGSAYYLDFKLTYPNEEVYESVIEFQTQQTIVDIVDVKTYVNDVESSNDTVFYNEEYLIVNNNLDATNSKISYQVTLKNNSNVLTYRFKNILDKLDSNVNSTYVMQLINDDGTKTDLNIADGILINPQEELKILITYNYNSGISDNSNQDIIKLEFKRNPVFQGVTEGVFSVASIDNSTVNNFGEFVPVEEDYEFVYSEDNALVFDGENTVAILDIDQSMAIDDAYSAYITIKADTNQAIETYANTILAVSDENGQYLFWLGVYKNYLHVYTYISGTSYRELAEDYTTDAFTSYYIGDYSNKIVNIQVTTSRTTESKLGTTKIYINGNLVREFTSGNEALSFKNATLGDLRVGRGLYYTGNIYDVALYNKELSASQAQINWQYAKTMWGIVE